MRNIYKIIAFLLIVFSFVFSIGGHGGMEVNAVNVCKNGDVFHDGTEWSKETANGSINIRAGYHASSKTEGYMTVPSIGDVMRFNDDYPMMKPDNLVKKHGWSNSYWNVYKGASWVGGTGTIQDARSYKPSKSGTNWQPFTYGGNKMFRDGSGTYYRYRRPVKITRSHFSEDKKVPKITVDVGNRSWGKGDVKVTYKSADVGCSGFHSSRAVWTQSTSKPSNWGAWVKTNPRTVTTKAEGVNYLHVESKDNNGNTAYKRFGPYRVDRTSPEASKPVIGGNGYTDGDDYWVVPKSDITIRASGVDKGSKLARNYVRLSGAGNDMRYYHDWGSAEGVVNAVSNNFIGKDTVVTGGTIHSNGTDTKSYNFKVNIKDGTNGKDFRVMTYFRDVAGNNTTGSEDGYVPSGQVIKVDGVGPSYISSSLKGAEYVKGKNHWVKPGTELTLNLRQRDTGSGNGRQYIKLTGAGDVRASHIFNGNASNKNTVGTFPDYNEDVVIKEANRKENSDYGRVDWKIVPKTSGKTIIPAYHYTDNVGNAYGYDTGAGNVGAVIKTDGVAPVISFRNEGDTGNFHSTEWVNGDGSVRLKFNDSLSGYKRSQYVWSTSESTPSSGWSAWNSSSNYVVKQRSSGQWYLHVRAEDNVGNTVVERKGVYKIDNTKPTFPSVSVSDGWSNKNKTVSISGGTDGHSGVGKIEYKINNGKWITYSKAFEVSSNGENEVKARVVDKVGNISGEVFKKVKVDKVKPTGNLTQTPGSSTWTKGNVILNLKDIKDTGGSGYYRTKLPDGSYVSANSASHVVTSNGKYKFVIYDNAGNSTVKSANVENIDKVKPNVSMSISSVGETSVGVSVNASDGQSGLHGTAYRYYQDGVDKTGWVSTKTHNYKGLTLNKQYKFKVEVRDVVGNVTEVSKGETTLAKVPIISTKVLSNSEIELKIDGKGNPAGTTYYVQRATDNKFSKGIKVVSNWKGGLSIKDSGLVPGETYYYRVKARNGKNKETVYSPVVNDITIPGDPKVIGIEVTDYVDSKSTKELNIKWESKLGVDDYLLYRDGKLIKTLGKSNTSYTDSSLVSNKEYSYEVRARNKSGTSDKGNTLKSYTRAHSGKGADIVEIKDTEFTVDIEESEVKQDKNPEYKLEVRKVGGTAVENTVDSYSRGMSDRVVKGLNPAVYYELWLYTRNEDDVVNPGKKVVEEFILNRPPEISLDMVKGEYSEQKGYNEIDIKGYVKDHDKGDQLEIRYSIFKEGKVLSSFDKVLAETKTSTGGDQSFSYKLPVDSKLSEGTYELLVGVKDPFKEYSESSFKFKVDKTKPLGELEIGDLRKRSAELRLKGVRDGFLGLPKEYALFHSKLNKGNYNKEGSWIGEGYLDTGELDSNSKYTYKVDIRDKVDNTLTTNEVEFVTAPEIVNKDNYYLEDDTSTIQVEWENPLDMSNEVHIEVKRSGALVGVVRQGSRFVDRNLDYEREYSYTFVAVSKDSQGKRIESVPVEREIKTGVPLLGLYLDADYDNINDRFNLYKSVFHKDTIFEGSLYHKQGGVVNLSYGKEGNKGDLDIILRDNEYKNFLLSHRFEVGEVFLIKAVLVEGGVSKTAELDAVVMDKPPEVSPLDVGDFRFMYKG